MISDGLGKPGYPFDHNAVLPKLELFNDQNAIVADNVHLGYNQEDSLVMKRASLGRDMLRSEHIRSYKAKVDNKEQTDKRRKSEDSITFGENIKQNWSESGTDHRVKLKHTKRGMVQKVVLSSNDEGKNFAVVQSPHLGDKFLKHAWAKRVFWAFWSLQRTSLSQFKACS
ncbi:DNA-DIRECTED RNA polymerase SUBUNIT BETA [Salix viminalis]|uniref:DNA-directed RNA polymerase n=1 Tax=Salix viminalis TaxID=40686 RepID=A0A9Q0UG83_SALVM|nr:DNA-DIRECTED RNA polymerase SUBUNIT BETA [Salix viminalis]